MQVSRSVGGNVGPKRIHLVFAFYRNFDKMLFENKSVVSLGSRVNRSGQTGKFFRESFLGLFGAVYRRPMSQELGDFAQGDMFLGLAVNFKAGFQIAGEIALQFGFQFFAEFFC